MKYSASTGGFYSAEIHGENIPDDALDISLEFYQGLLNAQSNGMKIIPGEDGFPILVEYDPPVPTYQSELADLNAAWQKKVDSYNRAFAVAALSDGPSEESKKLAIRADYEADRLQNSADRAALKTKYEM